MVRVYGKKGEEFIFLFGFAEYEGLGYDLDCLESYTVPDESTSYWDKETNNIITNGPFYEKLTLSWLSEVKTHIQKFMSKLEDDIRLDENLIKLAIVAPKVDGDYIDELKTNVNSNKESLEESRLSLGQLDILEIMVSDAVGFNGEPWGDFEGIFVNKGKN